MHGLEEGDIELRRFTLADAPAFVTAVRESQASVGRWMAWAHSQYAESDALAWFGLCDAMLAEGSAYEFGIFQTSTGALLGGAGLNQFNKLNNFCNLGYWVRQSAQRQGVATAATRRLIRLAFTELALTRVEIVVAEGNAASMGVALRVGGTHECRAENRVIVWGRPMAAHVYSLLPRVLESQSE